MRCKLYSDDHTDTWLSSTTVKTEGEKLLHASTSITKAMTDEQRRVSLQLQEYKQRLEQLSQQATHTYGILQAKIMDNDKVPVWCSCVSRAAHCFLPQVLSESIEHYKTQVQLFKDARKKHHAALEEHKAHAAKLAAEVQDKDTHLQQAEASLAALRQEHAHVCDRANTQQTQVGFTTGETTVH